jgi:GT2 family glycosyltransferase
MKKTLVRLGVVTVTFNAARHLAQFIQCCKAQTHENYELVIIDNASVDETKAVVTEYQDLRFCYVQNLANIGYAAACNQGTKLLLERGAQEILFINNDTEFGIDLFQSLSVARAKYSADAITPRITIYGREDFNWYAGGRFVFWKAFQAEMMGEGKPNEPNDNAPRWTAVAPGCCIMFSAAALKIVGPFDETFFVYFEDTDYCLRMLYAGLRLLYVPDITIAHKVSSSTGGPKSNFSIRYYQRNQAYILRKHFSVAIVVSQIPIIVLKGFVRFLMRRDTGKEFVSRLRATSEGLKLRKPPGTPSRFTAPKMKFRD